MKRVFLIVLDGFGIGEAPDAGDYGDAGSDTLAACAKTPYLSAPNMRRLGLFNVDGVSSAEKSLELDGCFGRAEELSKGKDTTTGHWEIAGLISDEPMPTFPNGFPDEVLDRFKEACGRGVLCNKPYSGTAVIRDYGKESVETGALIVYTSADSVFQIAAHEDAVPLEELYDCCKKARSILTGKFAVGRVIARPFKGEYPDFYRTDGRRDFSLEPHGLTMLDQIVERGLEVIAVGKINDIFAGKGISSCVKTKGNANGIDETLKILKTKFEGLCFVNLVDFDMLYGHRNDPDGFAKALSYFDERLKEIKENLSEDDLLIITADHGCDPSTKSTDHSREYVPILIYGKKIKSGVNLGTRRGFCDMAATVLDYLGIRSKVRGTSFLEEVLKINDGN